MMLKLTNMEKSKIHDFISSTLKNSNLEFEAKFQSDTHFNQKILLKLLEK